MKFCNKQVDTKDCGLQCAAHLHEGRVFNCPFKNAEDVNSAEFKCLDFEKYKSNKEGNTK